MSFDISKDKRDRKAESDGKWMPYGKGCSFLVARNNNSGYKGFISKALRDNADILESKTDLELAESISDDAMLQGAAEFLVLDWKGVTDNGKPVKYSVKKAKEILEEHDDLARKIVSFSTSRDNYLLARDKKDAKNLGK